MSSPLEQMAATLSHKPWPSVRAARAAGTRREESKAGRIRHLLAVEGPQSSLQIATAVDLESTSLVGALLKSDLQKGRVMLDAGRYRLNAAFIDSEQVEIGAAVRLLRRHGYRVVQP